MELSDRVKLKRKELGLTQEELAHRMGYKSRVSINKIEMGRPITQKIIVKLAEALDTTPSYLMGWEDEEPKRDNTNEDIEIGKTLTSLREAKNLTREEMAKEFNISIDDLKAYEQGLKRIPLELMNKLAEYFNVDFSNNVNFVYTVPPNQSRLQTSLHIIEITKRWNEEVGEANFTDEEVTELINFAKYLLSKRKDK